ncbi:diacylglycerol kinase family lipid kinase [bacterium]|nr:diacylglycerol kinase family lipid kinase [bacterium]
MIFNPVARGEKASAFRARLESLQDELEFRQTTSPESARNLGREAVEEGFDTIVAVGGDGTFNEVLNGVGMVDGAFESVKLGVLPLGTANVFAKELGLPMGLEAALEVVRGGKTRLVDLALASFECEGKLIGRYFGQLAGAGLDARAIELVDWESKKRFGVLAYVEAGLKALAETQVKLSVSNGEEQLVGELVLVGNGRFYGGKFELFPTASLTDGMLHAVVFERVHWADIVRRGWGLFTQTITQQEGIQIIKGKELKLTSDRAARFQLEGDVVGSLPCSFRLHPKRLQMIVP